MADYTELRFLPVGEIENGALVVVQYQDRAYVGLKGERENAPFVVVLAEDTRDRHGDAIRGPLQIFEELLALDLGKKFKVRFEPSPVGVSFVAPNHAGLGTLAITREGACVCFHGPAGLGLFCLETGSEIQPLPRRVAVVEDWAIGLRNPDDSINWLYQRRPAD